ncbi:hypothetical protein BAXH7_02835 [Bacillus amyloliquefaciens XH7]|nr:hypothetical protein BAXH7_02835 [Bacillus amyloliquefaciens XH7]
MLVPPEKTIYVSNSFLCPLVSPSKARNKHFSEGSGQEKNLLINPSQEVL